MDLLMARLFQQVRSDRSPRAAQEDREEGSQVVVHTTSLHFEGKLVQGLVHNQGFLFKLQFSYHSALIVDQGY